MSKRSAIVIGVAAACVAALGAQTATAAKPKPQEQHISLLFAQTATKGTMKPVKGTPRFNLKLYGVNPQVVWFSDRPARQSGQISVRGFARSWAGFGFLDDPPNAALTLLHAGDRHDTVIVKLGKPHFKPRKQLVRYSARRLDAATGNLSYLNSDVDPRVRRHFRAPSLFIDDASAVVNGFPPCVIQPFTVCHGADLPGADLSGADLKGADLSGADLSDADLTFSNLSGADLSVADLRRANLYKADLHFAELRAADLTGTDLRYAHLCRTTMPNSSINNRDC